MTENIVVYGKTNCVFCVAAKKLLEQKGIAFEYRSLDDPTLLEEFKKYYPDAKTVPQILVDGMRIGGFSDLKEWLSLNTGKTRLLQG